MRTSIKAFFLVASLLCFPSWSAAQYYYPSVATAALTSAGPLSPSGIARLTFSLNPGTPTVTSAYFYFLSSDRKYSRTLSASDASTGVATATIDATWVNATYVSNGVRLNLDDGSYVYYGADGTLSSTGHLWFYPADGPRATFSALSFSVVNALATVTAPTLSTFSRASASTIVAGEPLVWNYTVAPGSVGSWDIMLQLRSGDGHTIIGPTISGTGAASGQITIPTASYWVNGTYSIQLLWVSDQNSDTTYSNNAAKLSGTSIVLTGGLDKAALPQLTDVQVQGAGPFGLGQTITVKCSVQAGSSPITQCNLGYSGPDSPSWYQTNVSIAADANGVGTLPVTSRFLDGRYSLYSIDIADATGHVVSYHRNGQYLIPAPSGLYVRPVNGDFTVAGALKIPPVIAQQPVGGSVLPGNTLALTVAVAGPSGTVQWYEGLAGDTSKPVATGYQFTPYQLSSTTTYWARVTTAYGSTDSQAATITVLYSSPKPVIVAQPSSVDSYTDNWGSLRVYAVGPGPLAYQWYKDGVAVPGATATELDFNPGHVSDNGDHTVTVSNANGSVTSPSVPVIFVGVPVITVPPVSATVAYGGTVSFSVTAIGGHLGYGWTFAGQKNYPASLSNATSRTLTLTNVQPNQAGTYQVQVYNYAGRIDSVPVTLTVTNVPIPVIKPIEAQYGQVDKYFGIELSATNYPVHFSATGLPAGLTIDDYGRLSGTPTASGTFNVEISATNAGGTAKVTFTLTVAALAYAPIITHQPLSQTVAWHSTVDLSVSAVGTPSSAFGLSYQWYFNGIPLTTDGTYSTYQIRADSMAQSGDYTVVVYGAVGSVTSAPAHVVVDTSISAPYSTATRYPDDQTVEAGATLTIAAPIAGTAPITYNWDRDGFNLSGINGHDYTMANISLADAGFYTVYATNAYGSIEVVAPRIIVNYTVQPTQSAIRSGQSVTLHVPDSTAVTYQWYEGKSGDTSKPISGATQSAYTTPSLNASTSYWVKVSARFTRYSSTAEVIVSSAPTSFAGTYFGTFSSGGDWAMVIDSNNTGSFVGYRTQPAQVLAGTVIVDPDGNFNVTTTQTSASDPGAASGAFARHISALPATSLALAGRISGGNVSSATAGMSGTLDSGSAGSGIVGTYTAAAIGSTTGSATVVVGPSGRAVVLIRTPNSFFGAAGVVGSDGHLVATTATADKLSVTLAPNERTAAITINASSGTTSSFYGLANGTTNTSRLINLSARTRVSTGANVAIVGFIFRGNDSKTLLIRGVGPSLMSFDIPDYLRSPTLGIYDSKSKLLWSGIHGGDPATVAAIGARVGAFPLVSNANDGFYLSAMNSGLYSVILSGEADVTGVGMAEIYDADSGAGSSRLINISTRARTGAGSDVLTAGFVIAGTGPETVLLRAVGPGLTTLLVPDAIARPRLVLFNAAHEILATNSGWAGDSTLQDAFTRAGAFPLDPSSRDAAALVTLPPGGYSVQVQSEDGGAGVALVEVYELK